MNGTASKAIIILYANIATDTIVTK